MNRVDFEPKPLVLHGSPIIDELFVLWEQTEEVQPINSCIADHTIQMEIGTLLDWSMDLIEIDDLQADVVYSNIEVNGIVIKAKQDTGAQINVMSRTVFKDIQHEHKLPLYPKTCIKLMAMEIKLSTTWALLKLNVSTMALT